MQTFEGEVAEVVAQGETVYYSVGLHYFGRVIPNSVTIFYTGDEGSTDSERFTNKC
jgi:hypothetical protein